jgi:glycosyltransferase involved in cell wall biosynthesis
MTLQFKNQSNIQPPAMTHSPGAMQVARLGIHGMAVGTPPGIPELIVANRARQPRTPPPMAMPGAGLGRAIDYYADHGGCGFWRMIWPGLLMNGYQKAIINGLTSMVLDPRFYQGIKAVRLQRQATPMQLEFVKFLKHFAQQHEYKIIYEIDDIIFRDDIPDFNRCKVAFEDESILQSALEMMQMCDEISVTCEYMKQYYIDKTGNKNITVIPNYPPKFWGDGHYNKKELMKNFDKNKKKPRILYSGSGTHVDVTNRTNQQDDFTHVIQAIIKSRKDFQWVFKGCFPLPLKPFIDSGEMEYVPWGMFLEYPETIADAKVNAAFAPLMDCHFNRAKSNIKYLEPAMLGIPGVFQDMETYEAAPLRFKTGDDLIDQVKLLLKDEQTYEKYSTDARKYAKSMWLNDHMDEFLELYFTPYGSPERKALLKNNPVI